MLDPVSAGIMAAGTVGAAALGDGGGGGGGVSRAPRYTEAQKDLLNKLINQELKPAIGRGAPAYPGTTVPDVPDYMQQVFEMTGDYPQRIGRISRAYSPEAGQPMVQQGQEAVSQLMEPFDYGQARQMWQNKFVEPAMQQFEQQTIPAIAERYGTGGTGSGLNKALATAGQNLSTQLGGQLSDILYRGQQANKQRRLQTIPEAYRMAMAPGDITQQQMSVQGTTQNLLSQLLGTGARQRQIAAEPLQEERQKWQYSRPYENPWLNKFLGQALGASAVEPYYKQEGPGLMSQMAPMLGQLGGAAIQSGMFGGSGVGAPIGGGTQAGSAPFNMTRNFGASSFSTPQPLGF